MPISGLLSGAIGSFRFLSVVGEAYFRFETESSPLTRVDDIDYKLAFDRDRRSRTVGVRERFERHGRISLSRFAVVISLVEARSGVSLRREPGVCESLERVQRRDKLGSRLESRFFFPRNRPRDGKGSAQGRAGRVRECGDARGELTGWALRWSKSSSV